MTELTSLKWWLSSFGDCGTWLVAVIFLGTAVLPLVLRWFRALPDRGIAATPALGVLLTTYTAWAWSFGKNPKSLLIIGALTAVAAVIAFVAWRAKSPLAKGAMAFVAVPLLAAVPWPHTGFTILVAALLWAAVGIALWWGNLGNLLRTIRLHWPLIASTWALFVIGFLFFVNVRSYIPYATYEPGMSGAEKFDNFAHLNAVMRARYMPPEDCWWAGKPINYYYGGHLTSATLAKLTGTPAAYAFNMGLAMVFALTLTSGFCLGYNVVERRVRRWRPLWSSWWRRATTPIWIRGMGWGVFTAIAIALFGNLDPWQQLFARDLSGVRSNYDAYYKPEIDKYLAWKADRAKVEVQVAKLTGAKLAPGATPKGSPTGDQPIDKLIEELAVIDARKVGRPPASELSTTQLRWTLPNFLFVDFWRSSRMIKGSITEFPYFSAILGDHHAHHYALPFSIITLVAATGLLRLGGRLRNTNATEFLARTWPNLLALGFMIGAVFPINAWDAIILGPGSLLVLCVALARIRPEPSFRFVTPLVLYVAIMMVGALILNARPGMLLLLQNKLPLLIPIVVLAIPAILDTAKPGSAKWWVWGAAAAVLAAILTVLAWIFDGEIVPGTMRRLGGISASDVLLVFGVVAAITWWMHNQDGKGWRWLGLLAVAYGAVGFLALLSIIPFKAYFHSPFKNPDPLFLSLFPPQLDPGIFKAPNFWAEFWKRVPVNPFQPEIRSELRDYFGHWGQFAFPSILLLFITLRRTAARWTAGWRWGLWSGLITLAFWVYNLMSGYWVGPLTLTLAVASAVIAFNRQRDTRIAPTFVFLAIAFFYGFFVEVLHFDDNYSGELERYNTPFKIYYPLWPMLAVGLTVMLKELIARKYVDPRSRGELFGRTTTYLGALLAFALLVLIFKAGGAAIGITIAALLLVLAFVFFPLWRPESINWPFVFASFFDRLGTRIPLAIGVIAFLAIGMLYPIGATATRTNWFFTESVTPGYLKMGEEKRTYTERTLDATAYLGEKKRFKDDYAMIQWINANIKEYPLPVILERIGDGAYQVGSRFATNTGYPTLLGWEHHELQWRGWTVPVSKEDLERFGEPLRKRQPIAGKDVEMVHLTGLIREDVDRIYRSKTYEEVAQLLKFHKIRYIVVGSLEREVTPGKPHLDYTPGLAKFDQPPFKKVHQIGNTALYSVEVSK